MIQATDNDLLRNAAGQFSAPQTIQHQLWGGTGAGITPTQVAPSPDSSQVNLSDTSKLLNAVQTPSAGANPLLDAIGSLTQALTGKKISDISLSAEKLEASYFSYDSVQESLKVGNKSGLDYRYRSVHAEGEQLSYSAQGAIKLEDGSELTFDFSLQMSRIVVEETRARVQVDGSQLRQALGDIPGVKAYPREAGFDADMDHHGVRRMLDGIEESRRGHGRHRGHRHDDHDHEHQREVRTERTDRRERPIALAA